MVKDAVNRANPEAVVSIKAAGKLYSGTESAVLNNGFIPVVLMSDLALGQKVKTNTWVEIDSFNTERPKVENINMLEQNYTDLSKSALLSGAPYVSFMMGFLWGERAKFTSDYRRPLKGDSLLGDGFKQTMKQIAKLGRPSTPEAYYELGYKSGVNFPKLPKVTELGQQAKAAITGLMIDYAGLKQGNNLQKAAAPEKVGAYFTLARAMMSSEKSMSEENWQAGWSYIAELERKINNSTDDSERAGNLGQLFGFVRGINEKLVAQRYAEDGSIDIPDEKSKDINKFMVLLALIDLYSINPREALKKSATMPELTNDTLKAIAKARELELSGGSAETVSNAIREAINPVIGGILKNGGIMPSVAFDAKDESQVWEITELFRLFNLLAERKLKKINGEEQFEQIMNIEQNTMGIASAG